MNGKSFFMKKLLMCFLFFVSAKGIKAQKLNPDSAFKMFERCVINYLTTNYVQDTTYGIYYGNKLNYYINKFTADDGGVSYSGWAATTPDSNVVIERGYQRSFYRGTDFGNFISSLLSGAGTNAKCKIPALTGTVFFVNCPAEMWYQLFFDEVLYDDKLYLTPTIDIIKSDDKGKYHKRELLICDYSKKEGFRISKVIVVREGFNCQ